MYFLKELHFVQSTSSDLLSPHQHGGYQTALLPLEDSARGSPLTKIPEEDDNTSQASTVITVAQSHLHHQQQQQQQQTRCSNSPAASMSTNSSSTTLPLSSSPHPTPSSMHSTPLVSSDTEGEGDLDEKTKEKTLLNSEEYCGRGERFVDLFLLVILSF